MLFCKVGDLVEFEYLGGTHYGVTRQIKVTEFYSQHSLDIGGIDVLNGNKYKNFKTNKIRNLRVLIMSKPMAEEAKDLEVLFAKHPVWVDKMLPDFNTRHKVSYIWNASTKKLTPSTIKCECEIDHKGTIILRRDNGKRIIIETIGSVQYINCDGFVPAGSNQNKIKEFIK